MPDGGLTRRSPLDGVLVAGGHGGSPDAPVVIAERRGLSLVQVIARREAAQAVAERLGLDPAPVRASVVDAGSALWLAPGAWMVVAEGLEEGALYKSLLDDLQGLAAVIDQSHGRAALRLSGQRARDVLAKGCRLDLHPRAFTPGMCAQSAVAQIGVLFHQIDEVPTYDLYMFAGYALDFLEWLSAGAAEFGYRIEGS